jgi:MFS family permease
MIACDLIRALIVLSFPLLLREGDASSIALIYVLSFVQESISAFFEPARGAAIPQVVPPESLLTANTIGGATWSAMVAIGAALGGLATQHLGRNAAFGLNALSFVLSAILIASARIPPLGVAASDVATSSPPAHASGSLREGYEFLRGHPAQSFVVFLKGSWGLMGGILVLFSVFSDQIFSQHDPRAAAGCLGLLYAGRGLGALIGPYISRAIVGESLRGLSWGILVAYPTLLIGYMAFSFSSVAWVAALGLVVAHSGASTIWVNSTQLLQLTVPNRYLGRVIALELAICTAALCASTLGMGQLLDHSTISPRTAGIAVSSIPLITGTLWALARAKVVTRLTSDERSRTG